MSTFVVDRRKRPLMPCSEKHARLLLQRDRVLIYRLIPFTFRLLDLCQEVCSFQPPYIPLDLSGKATGRYLRTCLPAHKLRRGYFRCSKQVFGFQIDVLVSAEAPDGKKAGLHIGPMAVHASGGFNVHTPLGVVQDTGHRHCRPKQRADDYGYYLTREVRLPDSLPPLHRSVFPARQCAPGPA